MASPIGRVSYEMLAMFMRQYSDVWKAEGTPVYSDFGNPEPMPVIKLLEWFERYSGGLGEVYVFDGDREPKETVAEHWPNTTDVDDADEVDAYRVNVVVSGDPFLWIALTEEDASKANYVSLSPAEEPAADKPLRIKGFAIENFKGIREEVKLELRPITLLFGANSAGKSSVLHALHYAREIFERRNLDADQTIAGGEFVDLGGFRNFLHQVKTRYSEGDGTGVGEAYGLGLDDGSGFGDGRETISNNEIRLTVSISLSDSDLPEYRNPEDLEVYDDEPLFEGIREADVEVVIGWSDHLNAPHVTSYSVGFNGKQFASMTSTPGRRMPVLETVDLSHPILKKRRDIARFGEWGSSEPDDVDDGSYSGLAYLLNKVRRNAWVPVWEDDTARILETVSGQSDAMPKWDRPLPLNDWRDDGVADDPLDAPDRVKLESDNREINYLISRLVVGPGELIRNLLGKFRYLGPLRETPPRDFSPPRFPDPSRWATGLAAWDTLYKGSDELVDDVGSWLGDAENLDAGCRIERRTYLELDYGDPIVSSLMARRAFDDIDEHIGSYLASAPTTKRIVVVPEGSDVDLRPHDVGIGISQVVPVIVMALDSNNRLLTVEQPELHMHPRLQAEIADLFVESIKQQDHCFIIETHSEHLILRLLRRIRETELGKAPANRLLRTDDLAIYYLKQEQGKTGSIRIDVDVKGEFIQPWPDDFFEIDFYERFTTGEKR